MNSTHHKCWHRSASAFAALRRCLFLPLTAKTQSASNKAAQRRSTMAMQFPGRTASRLLLLAFLLSAATITAAQSVNAVPKLDLDRYMGTWYEVARYPAKPENHCLSDAEVLYALGDKKNTFQVVISCTIKDNNSDFWNTKGKIDKAGDGELKMSHFVLFSKKYWVLAIGQDYEWVLVGSPNHKSLWVLSRTTTLKPEVLAEIEAKAVEEGFQASKLKNMPQHNESSP
jgi:apolipoprotein D and lipocalin family protein